MEFYNYVYLDPRNKVKHKYGDIIFEYEPIYVGKGTKNRYKQHLQTRNINKNQPFYNRLKKIINDGYQPIIKILTHFDNEVEAYKSEMELIKLIGSNHIPTIKEGPLKNMTLDGQPPNHKGKTYKEIYGERAEEERWKRHKKQLAVGGFFRGHTHTDESKKKISESTKGENNPMWGKHHSDETKNRLRITSSNREGKKNYNSKEFIIIHMSGKCYLVEGELRKFCEDKNISCSTLKTTIKKQKFISRGKTEGWCMEYYSNMSNDKLPPHISTLLNDSEDWFRGENIL